jgi:hypothetical protein
MATLRDIENKSQIPGLPDLGQNTANPVAHPTLAGVINNAIPLLIIIAGFLLLFYLVAGGFGMMTSKGDPKAVEAAKSKITSALIGFVIIAIGYLLVQLIGMIFGVGNFEGIF